ncbi:MAG: hypothetical protein N2253_02430 [Bacteroidia bacterium]|nr:hypothetical protein [Bacteroidia bacterium]MCX7763732.1 hypothetical protein [Bacteroidia bacterium]MDW8058211.1 hypothetical protein [Bacteroidia bacterium]
MESLEATKARLARIERGIRQLRQAYEELSYEQKALLLAQRRQKERLRERLLRLREKIELALSYGRRNPNLDDPRTAPHRPGASEDNSAP